MQNGSKEDLTLTTVTSKVAFFVVWFQQTLQLWQWLRLREVPMRGMVPQWEATEDKKHSEDGRKTCDMVTQT